MCSLRAARNPPHSNRRGCAWQVRRHRPSVPHPHLVAPQHLVLLPHLVAPPHLVLHRRLARPSVIACPACTKQLPKNCCTQLIARVCPPPPPGVGAAPSASAFGAPSQLGGASAFGTCAFQPYITPRPPGPLSPCLLFARRWHWCFRRCSRRWCFWRRSRWWRWVCELRSSSCKQWIWGFGAGRRLSTCAVVWRTSLRQSQRTMGRCSTAATWCYGLGGIGTSLHGGWVKLL